jgi:hypothetical protein
MSGRRPGLTLCLYLVLGSCAHRPATFIHGRRFVEDIFNKNCATAPCGIHRHFVQTSTRPQNAPCKLHALCRPRKRTRVTHQDLLQWTYSAQIKPGLFRDRALLGWIRFETRFLLRTSMV